MPLALDYIPIGTLHLYGIAPSAPGTDDLTWKRFKITNFDTKGDDEQLPHASGSLLSQEAEGALLRQPALRPFQALAQQKWVMLEASREAGSTTGHVRVHVLPDDRCRQAIDRSNTKLQIARKKLISALDTSSVAWQGPRWPSAQTNDNVAAASGAGSNDSVEKPTPTLIQRFNMIESPAPSPEQVQDESTRQAMYALLSSRLRGLRTELYPHQRRSAATMIQRESEPGKVLDPRLLCCIDQDGRPWYHDPVGNVVLRDPLHYDGLAGGILAEEMGAGKTLICLSLVLASRGLPLRPPELCSFAGPPVRVHTGSLMRMAASCTTRNGIPWRHYFDAFDDDEAPTSHFGGCISALINEPGYYIEADPELAAHSTRKTWLSRRNPDQIVRGRIYMSAASLIVVPPNLAQQWQQEIVKHTRGLRLVMVVEQHKDDDVSLHALIDADIVLFTSARLEEAVNHSYNHLHEIIKAIHFKRCIVDEGHKLSNGGTGLKNQLLIALNKLHISHKWVITGTPSKGLYSIEGEDYAVRTAQTPSILSKQEQTDLSRIGTITKFFLKVRPWANSASETGDRVADWNKYMMAERRGSQSSTLQATFNSLMIRHRLSEVSTLLPRVHERIVRLEGTYQDILSLNVFNMMIIFNAVLSQRCDQDYFFHPHQRGSLQQLVRNMRQATFFGGLFFSKQETESSLARAYNFLRSNADSSLEASTEDLALLQEAILVGEEAVQNELRMLYKSVSEIPFMVANMPEAAGSSWSLDGVSSSNGHACSSSSMLKMFRKLLRNSLQSATRFNTFMTVISQAGHDMLSSLGRFRSRCTEPTSLFGKEVTLTTGGKKREGRFMAGLTAFQEEKTNVAPPLPLPEAFRRARVVATASAKLSYLMSEVAKHQADEQILIFYDDENVAWHVASALDVLEVRYLIYAQSLHLDRRARYVDTFKRNPIFRVLMMDISQAAFGLDIRVASRIYFINPVLNPQIEAQAIGRARRVGHEQRDVTVETLVLRDSIDEVIVERRGRMSALDHRRCRTVLDDRPMAEWIKNVRIVPMKRTGEDGHLGEMRMLDEPRPLFGMAFEMAEPEHPDEGLVERYDHEKAKEEMRQAEKRWLQRVDDSDGVDAATEAKRRKVSFDE